MSSVDVLIKVKRCTKCGDIKSLEDFAFSCKVLNYKKSHCKVCDNARKLKWQRDNKFRYNDNHGEWRERNRLSNRETVCKATMRYHGRTRKKALEVVSGKSIEDIKCVQCGFSDIRALQIDHINGGGGKHFKKRGSVKYYKDMLVQSEDYQILCANCNWIKRYTNNEKCSKYGQD